MERNVVPIMCQNYVLDLIAHVKLQVSIVKGFPRERTGNTILIFGRKSSREM